MKNLGKFKLNEDFNVFLISLIIVLIIAVITSCSLKVVDKEATNSLPEYRSTYSVMQPKLAVMAASVDEEVEEDDGFIFKEFIPLDEELQRFVYEKSLEYDIPETLIYAIMNVESNFNVKTRSHTKDSGLMQINDRTAKWIAKELDLADYDIYDPKTNIEFGVWYLNFLKEAWNSANLPEEDKAYLVVMSYNRGVHGAKNYVKKYGYNNKYVDKVFEYKIYLEEGGKIE